jgi:hypothetical protein
VLGNIMVSTGPILWGAARRIATLSLATEPEEIA